MAAAAKGASYVTTIAILGGIIAVGVFLLLLSILGVIAAYKNKRGLVFLVCRMHHMRVRSRSQYMVLLSLLFIIQFSVSIAVLAFNTSQARCMR